MSETSDLDSELLGVGVPKKKKVGRPPKEPVDPDETPRAPRGRKPKGRPAKKVSFDDEPQVEEEPATAQPEPEPKPEEADSPQIRAALCETIKGLRKRLGAIGSGLNPTLDHDVKTLRAEIALLNQELDCKRGEKSIKMLTIQVVAPLIMKVADVIGKSYERQNQPRPVDLAHLDEVIRDNWQDLFSDAAAQIAINHPEFFSAGPYSQFGEGLFAACATANYMNTKKAKTTDE